MFFSFNKYVLSTYYVSGAVLSTKDIVMNMTVSFQSHGDFSLVGGKINEEKMKMPGLIGAMQRIKMR